MWTRTNFGFGNIYTIDSPMGSSDGYRHVFSSWLLLVAFMAVQLLDEYRICNSVDQATYCSRGNNSAVV